MPSLWVDNAAGGQLAATGPYSQNYIVNRERNYADRGSSTDFKLTRIGTVTPGKGCTVRGADGSIVTMDGQGYDHFR